MKSLFSKAVQFLAADDGLTTVGYAMVILLVVLVCLTVIILVGQGASSSP